MSKYTKTKKDRMRVASMTEESVTRREFKYFNTLSNGGAIKLDFNLRVDTTEELEMFKEMMTKGLKDICDELDKHNK